MFEENRESFDADPGIHEVNRRDGEANRKGR